MTDAPEFIDVAQLAARWQKKERTIQSQAKAGTIPGVFRPPGVKEYRFRLSVIEEYEALNTTKTAKPKEE